MSADGSHLLVFPDGEHELVDPHLSEEQLAARYGLSKVVRMPEIELCTAIRLDGPLAGTTTHYAINQLGSQSGFALPPRRGGSTGTYELIKLASGDQPGELRFVELNGRSLTYPSPECGGPPA
ncbi:hypothetical protein [Actinomadura gamaensis]|uniref:Uncharacterized protein n=1 Tax=Actinomadura gamaensis TaxID=1763541 RepID=A0ABV9TTS8_9ACTN